MPAETEARAMYKQFRIYAFILLSGVFIGAQDRPLLQVQNLNDAMGNRSVSFIELLKQAEAGDKRAQYSVGNAYATGNGVLKNDADALKWWRQAAQNGLPEAQNHLAYLYERGVGVPQD